MEKNISNIMDMAKKMRKKAVQMAYYAGGNGAHLGAGLSSIEILACLYGGIMNIDPQHPMDKKRDIFIASKAHCVLAYYTALAYSGFFTIEELESFETNDSEFPGHPIMNISKGIEFSGGSLGMGFSQGVGIGLATKKKYNNKVYILLGDGECDEGAVWEAAMSAAHFQLDNVVAIIDRNKLQYDGETEEIMELVNLKSKFESFGFNSLEVDGHNVQELYKALYIVSQSNNKMPSVIIANTIKGKGISFMENRKEWHHAVLSREQYEKAMQELEE